jgi:hypothetical protein
MDEELRQIERDALAGDEAARERMLALKMRLGQLAPNNILVTIAGVLGHETIRRFFPRGQFLAAANENRALKRLTAIIVGNPEGMTRAEKIQAIRGILWFATPYYRPLNPNNAIIARKLLEKSQVPNRTQIDRAWEEPGTRGAATEVVGGEVLELRSPLTNANYLLYALGNISNRVGHQRNLWASYAVGLGPFRDLRDAAPLMTREQLLNHYRAFLDTAFFTWGVDLPADARLADYID